MLVRTSAFSCLVNPLLSLVPITTQGGVTLKTCSFCAEEIQDAAIVCKHCGRDVPGTAPARRRAAEGRMVGLAIFGLVFTATGIGAIIGIPMLIAAFVLSRRLKAGRK